MVYGDVTIALNGVKKHLDLAWDEYQNAQANQPLAPAFDKLHEAVMRLEHAVRLLTAAAAPEEEGR